MTIDLNALAQRIASELARADVTAVSRRVPCSVSAPSASSSGQVY